MTDITIEAGGFPHYQGPTNVEIWIVANKAFVTPDGKPISAGSVADAAWMVRVAEGIIVADNVLQVPEIIVDATEDAISGQDATLSAFVVTQQGRPVSALSVFRNFKVPPSPSSMSWAQLAVHNSSVVISPPV